jgi:hypothetical protein
LVDPYVLTYAIFDATQGIEYLMGSEQNTPARISMGQYFAQYVIPADANIGDWVIRWTLQVTSTDPVVQTVEMFNVFGNDAIITVTGDINLDQLIYSLRIMLRDNNPDRNYRFAPPSSERFIQGMTQVFGFLWEDEELLEYLSWAVDDFNSRPPVTRITVEDLWGSFRRWRTAILQAAAGFACQAMTANWVLNEFSYSISGISLDIEKSSKYQALGEMFGGEKDKMFEAAKDSIKIIKGLKQFKFGIGIQSALGPLTRPGIQSRRNLITGGGPSWS